MANVSRYSKTEVLVHSTQPVSSSNDLTMDMSAAMRSKKVPVKPGW